MSTGIELYAIPITTAVTVGSSAVGSTTVVGISSTVVAVRPSLEITNTINGPSLEVKAYAMPTSWERMGRDGGGTTLGAHLCVV